MVMWDLRVQNIHKKLVEYTINRTRNNEETAQEILDRIKMEIYTLEQGK